VLLSGPKLVEKEAPMTPEMKPAPSAEQDAVARARRRAARAGRRKRRRRKKTGTVLTFVVIGIVVLLGLIYVEFIRSTPGESTDVRKGLVLGPVAGGKYDDDITKGRSKRGFVKVSVKVDFMRGKIQSVEVLSHRHLWPKAKRATIEIPKRIVEQQSTKVRAVSGATLSSKAIMLAVQNALDNNHEKRVQRHKQTGEGGRWDDKY
jgi:uncharacterized protein with FMN-binding domain